MANPDAGNPPDAVDDHGMILGFSASAAMSTMRRDLYAYLEDRGWHMTGSGVGESHYTGRDVLMVDVSAKKEGRSIIIEIHELGILS